MRDAAGRFRAVFGTAPERLGSAPGRVNLIGEHTDYSGGLALPLAVGFRADVAARRTATGRLRIASAQRPGEVVDVPLAGLAPGAVTGWAAYLVGAVWALPGTLRGADLLVDSDIPPGAGLSSSAALECAALGALGMEPGLELAQAAQRAENDFVGVPCGLMDQVASTLGRDGHALLFDARALSCRPVPLELGDLGLLVLDTRSPHALDDGAYARRRHQVEEAARLLGVASLRDADLPGADSLAPPRAPGAAGAPPVPGDDASRAARWAALPPTLAARARHVVTENARVAATVALLEAGDLTAIGPLLTASHASLRDDFEVTVPHLDVAVEAALDAGALGARMTGGGFGGSIVALTRAPAAAVAAVTGAYTARGWGAPGHFLAEPSLGLRSSPL